MRDDRLLTAEGRSAYRESYWRACTECRRRRPLAGFEPKSCNLKMPVRVYNFVLLRAMDKATYGSTSPSRPTAPTGWRLLQPASQWRRATLQLINVSVKKKDTWKRKGKQKKKKMELQQLVVHVTMPTNIPTTYILLRIPSWARDHAQQYMALYRYLFRP